jgi:hypothetical protein
MHEFRTELLDRRLAKLVSGLAYGALLWRMHSARRWCCVMQLNATQCNVIRIILFSSFHHNRIIGPSSILHSTGRDDLKLRLKYTWSLSNGGASKHQHRDASPPHVHAISKHMHCTGPCVHSFGKMM